jgi:hypothetical protein
LTVFIFLSLIDPSQLRTGTGVREIEFTPFFSSAVFSNISISVVDYNSLKTVAKCCKELNKKDNMLKHFSVDFQAARFLSHQHPFLYFCFII